MGINFSDSYWFSDAKGIILPQKCFTHEILAITIITVILFTNKVKGLAEEWFEQVNGVKNHWAADTCT